MCGTRKDAWWDMCLLEPQGVALTVARVAAVIPEEMRVACWGVKGEAAEKMEVKENWEELAARVDSAALAAHLASFPMCTVVRHQRVQVLS